MIQNLSLRSTAIVGLLALMSAVMQACATAPKQAPSTAKAAPPPARTTPNSAASGAEAKMAPIPNPPDPAKSAPPAAVVTRPPAKSAPPKTTTVKPSVAPATTADPARAAKLRAAGLEQLNRGAIDKAVGLLQQALALDPGNTLIQHDLDRALRISQVVHTKP